MSGVGYFNFLLPSEIVETKKEQICETLRKLQWYNFLPWNTQRIVKIIDDNAMTCV